MSIPYKITVRFYKKPVSTYLPEINRSICSYYKYFFHLSLCILIKMDFLRNIAKLQFCNIYVLDIIEHL